MASSDLGQHGWAASASNSESEAYYRGICRGRGGGELVVVIRNGFSISITPGCRGSGTIRTYFILVL